MQKGSLLGRTGFSWNSSLAVRATSSSLGNFVPKKKNIKHFKIFNGKKEENVSKNKQEIFFFNSIIHVLKSMKLFC